MFVTFKLDIWPQPPPLSRRLRSKMNVMQCYQSFCLTYNHWLCPYILYYCWPALGASYALVADVAFYGCSDILVFIRQNISKIQRKYAGYLIATPNVYLLNVIFYLF